MRYLPPLLLLALATGCASNLSTLQTAKPLAPGQFQVSLGAGAFIPVGQIGEAIDLGINEGKKIKDAVDSGESVQLSEEDQQRLLTSGVALAVAPPGIVNEVMIRAGVVKNLDVGLRYSGISLRLDTKFRFLHGGDGENVPENRRTSYDMAIGLGGSRHTFKSPVLDVMKIVKVDDFKRYDIEVPLYMSTDFGDILRLYAAPKYVYSRTSLDEKLVNYAEQGKDVSGFDASLPATVKSEFVGSTLGVSVGYKYVHLFAEITGGYTFCKPLLFGETRNLGGATFYPAVGIAFRNSAPQRPSADSTRVD
ncbi:hypothetical protein [Hyalangium versicolor]|uniref:hypothetical protein n=1 Tax=Hyalangium versicolor TaxID=2861190 RepID=UPI001CCA7193|nr:hypothetical protein [Hyalangium versicolor]